MAEEINDKPAALGFLKEAEVAVKSNEDFKKTAEAVLKYADDQQWIEAIKDQQQRREEHGALYKEFITREGECTNTITLCRLAEDVVARTGDKHYARKLYTKAAAKGRYFPEFMALADTVSANLEDADWVRDIYTRQLETRTDEIDINNVVAGVLKNLQDMGRKAF